MINRHALQALRTKDGRRRADLARAVGVSPQYYSDIENGRRGLSRSPEVVRALAVALDVPTSALTCCHGHTEPTAA